MTSPEKRRQIENWALTVAACANGIDELRVNEAPVTSGTERSGTTATSYGTSIQHGTIKPLRDSHVVRVVVQESSSEGSTRSRDRSREVRSSRPVVESFARRQNPPPRTSRNRPSTPPGTYVKYNVVRRVSRATPPEPEPSSRYYVDDRPWYYKEEQLRPPSIPSKPSRPRPRSMDSRRIYYPRQPSPPTQRTAVRSPPPQRATYVPVYDNPPHRTVSMRDRGDTRMVGDRSESAQQPNQRYDDVDRLRSIGTRRVYPPDDSRRRGRSFEHSSYDDYDHDYYDDRRRPG